MKKGNSDIIIAVVIAVLAIVATFVVRIPIEYVFAIGIIIVLSIFLYFGLVAFVNWLAYKNKKRKP